MEVVVIHSKVWVEMEQRLLSLEKLILEHQNKQQRDNHAIPPLDYVPLSKVREMLGISKDTYKRRFSKMWRKKKFGVNVWIYRPDLEKWLREKNFQ